MWTGCPTTSMSTSSSRSMRSSSLVTSIWTWQPAQIFSNRFSRWAIPNMISVTLSKLWIASAKTTSSIVTTVRALSSTSTAKVSSSSAASRSLLSTWAGSHFTPSWFSSFKGRILTWTFIASKNGRHSKLRSTQTILSRSKSSWFCTSSDSISVVRSSRLSQKTAIPPNNSLQICAEIWLLRYQMNRAKPLQSEKTSYFKMESKSCLQKTKNLITLPI